jgi:hypothetical protein
MAQLNAYAKRSAGAVPPPAVMMVHNAELSAEYRMVTGEPRPKGDLTIGIRLPSESAERDIRKRAMSEGAENSDEFNRQVVILYCAKAICDPNDQEKSHPDFAMPDEQLPRAITGQALSRVFDFVERLRIEQSPTFPEASDAELQQLGRLLLDGADFDEIGSARESRFRKLCAFLLTQIG